MANSKTDEKAQAAVAGADTEALTAPASQGVAVAGGANDIELEGGDLATLPPEFIAEITAQIQGDLKTLFVDKLTSAKSLMENETNLLVNDAFLMNFQFSDDKFNGQRVVYEVISDSGLTYYVAQSPIGSRLSWVSLFENVRKIGRKLTIPNCQFREVGTGKFGNRPIILSPSTNSKPQIR